MIRVFKRFDRERCVREILRKRIFLVVLMKIRFLKRIKRNGPSYLIRQRNEVHHSISSVGGGLMRNAVKERAKNTIRDLLSWKMKEQEFYYLAKWYHYQVLFFQRT